MQAADFSILAIALVTLLMVMRIAYILNASSTTILLVCLAVWVIPVATSITAAAMGLMTVVYGNWCWISSDRPDLRLVLAHGWRFAVILSAVAVYMFIWWYLQRQFTPIRTTEPRSYGWPVLPKIGLIFPRRREKAVFEVMRDEEAEFNCFGQHKLPGLKTGQRSRDEAERPNDRIFGAVRSTPRNESYLMEDLGLTTPAVALHPGYIHRSSSDNDKSAQGPTLRTNASEFPMRPESHEVEREIKRMLLLNAYPFMYVVLWIPGLVGRFMEAAGHPPSTRTIAALQVSTQFIGCANALTYGFGHHLRNRLKGIYVNKVAPSARYKLRR